MTVLPTFLAKPMRGERLDPKSEDFRKNRAFGKAVGVTALAALIGAPVGGAFGGVKGALRGLAVAPIPGVAAYLMAQGKEKKAGAFVELGFFAELEKIATDPTELAERAKIVASHMGPVKGDAARVGAQALEHLNIWFHR